MTAADYPHQAITPYGFSWQLNSCKESIRRTILKQDSELKNQIAELHRVYKRQIELMKEFKEILIRKYYNEQLETKTQEKQVYQAAETLVSMSSPLFWFAKTVTSVKSDDEVAFVPKRARTTRVAAVVASRQQIAHQMQQHNKRLKEKKQKRVNVEPKFANVKPKACIHGWGEIKKGKRRKRVRNRDPICTFLRGGNLCRWR